eukprot:975800_1
MPCKYPWPRDDKLSRPCKNFICCLLQLDCHKRMSPSDALKHPFLTGDASEVSLGSAYLQNICDFDSGNVLKKMIVDMGRDEKKILSVIRAFREIDLDRNGFIEGMKLLHISRNVADPLKM